MKKKQILWIAVLAFISLMAYSQELPKSKNLSTAEFASWVKKTKNNPKFILMDIRTAEEFNSGFIEKAVNLDFYSSDLQEKIAKLDKTKYYLIYCRSGNRSGKFLQLLEQAGIKNAYHLATGINDWIYAGYPIKRKN